MGNGLGTLSEDPVLHPDERGVGHSPFSCKMSPNLQQTFAKGVQYNMKVVIRGDANTGKTTLLRRLQGGGYSELYVPTPVIQAGTIKWKYKATNDVVKVEVWDVVDGVKKKAAVRDSLKLTNEKDKHDEEDEPSLDASFIDVYKDTHGVIIMLDITRPWTWTYAQREIALVPNHIPILLVANKRDLWQQRQVRVDEIKVWVELLSEQREIDFCESCMKDGFGLQYLYDYLSLPFLRLQRETFIKQLELNEQEIGAIKSELRLHSMGPKQDYAAFLQARGVRQAGLPTSSQPIIGQNTLSGTQLPDQPGIPTNPVDSSTNKNLPPHEEDVGQPGPLLHASAPEPTHQPTGVDLVSFDPSDPTDHSLDDFFGEDKGNAVINEPVAIGADSETEDNPQVAKIDEPEGDFGMMPDIGELSEEEGEEKMMRSPSNQSPIPTQENEPTILQQSNLASSETKDKILYNDSTNDPIGWYMIQPSMEPPAYSLDYHAANITRTLPLSEGGDIDVPSPRSREEYQPLGEDITGNVDGGEGRRRHRSSRVKGSERERSSTKDRKHRPSNSRKEKDETKESIRKNKESSRSSRDKDGSEPSERRSRRRSRGYIDKEMVS